eukprot:CAMPEP_0183744802 /NCGR_PEP_ID=MMETSP0737-20130205/65917_1 /TAXON_ID=385413 /ORGANISM="Thalassiosira miniscula, Strain CCMP1093" /LENGTH=512 /DNA_ID=CAMNT_0025980455 /DNA_START=305 /DNA_END=1844 /DNA_ORIENTATION=+
MKSQPIAIASLLQVAVPTTFAAGPFGGRAVEENSATSSSLLRRRSELLHKSNRPKEQERRRLKGAEDYDPYLGMAASDRKLDGHEDPMSMPAATGCSFCPDGLTVPADTLLPTNDGANCGTVSSYAATVAPGGQMCDTLKLAETLCCPKEEPPTTSTCPDELTSSVDLADGEATFSYAVVDDMYLCGSLESNTESWIGFGINPTGVMLNGDGIVSIPETGTVAKVKLTDDNSARIQPVPVAKQTLVDTSFTQVDGKTTIKFGKLLTEPDEHEINPSGVNTFLFAIGSSNELGYHAKRDSFTLDLSGEPSDEEPVEEESMSMPADEEPVEEEPPVDEEPVDEEPVEEQQEPVDEEPVDEEPVDEEPVEEPAEEQGPLFGSKSSKAKSAKAKSAKAVDAKAKKSNGAKSLKTPKNPMAKVYKNDETSDDVDSKSGKANTSSDSSEAKTESSKSGKVKSEVDAKAEKVSSKATKTVDASAKAAKKQGSKSVAKSTKASTISSAKASKETSVSSDS